MEKINEKTQMEMTFLEDTKNEEKRENTLAVKKSTNKGSCPKLYSKCRKNKRKTSYAQ